jgi:hypothetical protein
MKYARTYWPWLLFTHCAVSPGWLTHAVSPRLANAVSSSLEAARLVIVLALADSCAAIPGWLTSVLVVPRHGRATLCMHHFLVEQTPHVAHVNLGLRPYTAVLAWAVCTFW